MKSYLFFSVLFLLITSCSLNKELIFIKVDHIEVVSFAKDTIRIKVDAFFENPNDVGGNITTDKMIVMVNDIEVAQVFSDDFKVPAKNEFTLPLFAKIPTKKLFDANKNGALGSVLNTIVTNKVKVRITGNLEYVVFGFKKDFLVDKTQEIKIKL